MMPRVSQSSSLHREYSQYKIARCADVNTSDFLTAYFRKLSLEKSKKQS